MRLIVVGMNYQTAGITLREKLALASNEQILRATNVLGVVVVSTCNRIELYIEAGSEQAALEWFASRLQLDLIVIKKYCYVHFDLDTARHLMQVASGLDSMVLGEVEILGQLKTAYKTALEQGYVTKGLSRLFESAFNVAKKVRSQTEIGLNPVSVASLAVRLAEKIFTRISDQVVLMIGAGDTAHLMLKHLSGIGVTRFIIANRTLTNAQTLALNLGTRANVELIDLNMLPDNLARADIVVTATNAPLPIVGKGMVEQAIKVRKYRSMFMLDLAVPRNIESQVQAISDVYLYGIDDLQTIAAKHKELRQVAVPQAEQIINAALQKFSVWLYSVQSAPTIRAFRTNCEQVRDQALDEALQQLNSGKDPREVLNKFAHLLLNRLMHEPTIRLRMCDAETLE